MFLNKLWSNGIISGYLFCFLTTIILVWFFAFYIKRIFKIKKILTNISYFNKKMHYFLIIFFAFILLKFVFLVNITFILNFAYKENKILQIVFVFIYLFYSAILLFYIIYINSKQNSVIATVYENKLFLFNQIINLSNILQVSRNLKRTIIYLLIVENQNDQDLIKLKYHWKLYDFFKSLNLKIIF